MPLSGEEQVHCCHHVSVQINKIYVLLRGLGLAFIVVCAGYNVQVQGNVQVWGLMLGENKLYFKGVKRKLNWSLLGNKDMDETSWEAIQNKLLKCRDFKQLEVAVAKIKEPPFIASHIHNSFSDCDVIHDIALHFLPSDSPSGCRPVRNFGDGNCFAQAISQFIYGTGSSFRSQN